MPPRKVVTGLLLAAGSLAGSVLVRRRAARQARARRPLCRRRLDALVRRGHARRRAAAADRPGALRLG